HICSRHVLLEKAVRDRVPIRSRNVHAGEPGAGIPWRTRAASRQRKRHRIAGKSIQCTIASALRVWYTRHLIDVGIEVTITLGRSENRGLLRNRYSTFASLVSGEEEELGFDKRSAEGPPIDILVNWRLVVGEVEVIPRIKKGVAIEPESCA